MLGNIYISLLRVGIWRRCVKVKPIHDSVSTVLREGTEKPNAGISVPVIVYGELPVLIPNTEQRRFHSNFEFLYIFSLLCSVGWLFKNRHLMMSVSFFGAILLFAFVSDF